MGEQVGFVFAIVVGRIGDREPGKVGLQHAGRGVGISEHRRQRVVAGHGTVDGGLNFQRHGRIGCAAGVGDGEHHLRFVVKALAAGAGSGRLAGGWDINQEMRVGHAQRDRHAGDIGRVTGRGVEGSVPSGGRAGRPAAGEAVHERRGERVRATDAAVEGERGGGADINRAVGLDAAVDDHRSALGELQQAVVKNRPGVQRHHRQQHVFLRRAPDAGQRIRGLHIGDDAVNRRAGRGVKSLIGGRQRAGISPDLIAVSFAVVANPVAKNEAAPERIFRSGRDVVLIDGTCPVVAHARDAIALKVESQPGVGLFHRRLGRDGTDIEINVVLVQNRDRLRAVQGASQNHDADGDENQHHDERKAARTSVG